MPRPPRDLSSAPYFHVINRAIDSHDLFVLDQDFVLFERYLGECVVASGARIHAYALMSNHFHLVVEPLQGDGLSQAIGDAQSRYAKAFNRRTERRGTLFDRRFLAFGIHTDDELMRVTQYIHANPVAITGERTLPTYRWSSLPAYLGRSRPAEWLTTDVVASMISCETHLASVLGRRSGQDIALRARFTEPPPSITRIHECVARQVRTSRIDESWTRRLTSYVAAELRAADVVQVACHFRCSTSTIRRGATKCRSKISSNDAFARFANGVVAAVVASNPESIE